MKKFLAIAAAGGALAIGVPAAIAATDAPSTTTNTPVQSATPAPDQQRPDREDCPEKDGRGGGSGGSDNQGSSAPYAPATPSL